MNDLFNMPPRAHLDEFVTAGMAKLSKTASRHEIKVAIEAIARSWGTRIRETLLSRGDEPLRDHLHEQIDMFFANRKTGPL